MDVEDFKKKYEQLKDNPMYKNFCSILDTKSQVLERTAKENQELKKKLDELQTLYNNMFRCHCNRVQVETLLSQQKEFIEWLEDYIDTLKTESDSVEGLGICEYYTLLALEEVLSKYKETIGVKDEKVNC